MKKKLSIILTLALASFVTTGCDLWEYLYGPEQQTPSQQEEEKEQKPAEEEGKKDDEQQGKEEDTNFNVTFNANGGSGTMSSKKTRGSSYVVPACAFTYENHTFNKWALNSVNGQLYSAGQTINNISADITLFATWTENEQQITNYTVSFNANGGTGTMQNQTTNGSTYNVPQCAFEKTNHVFKCWALDTLSGTTYSPNETIFDIDADITLYAIWIENTSPDTNYTVTFNANGGTGEMAPQQTTGSIFTVPACSFSKEGYTFKNWAYNSKTGVEYSVGEMIVNISNDITLYALWQEQQQIDPEHPDIPAGYYSQCEGLSGSSLQAKLLSINAPKSPSYDWGRYEDADEALDDSTSILCVYTRHNIKKSSHCGTYSWDKWNREHVWTQSKFPASDKDNHNIFACEGQINNYRGNKPFAEGGSVVVVFGHTTGCKQTSDTFEPCDEAKGEIARSVMYGTVMYSYTMTQEIDSIALALKWHLEHPITERDIRRNDVVYENQGNRNPFVDHPEYACKIWGNTNSATKKVCGLN